MALCSEDEDSYLQAHYWRSILPTNSHCNSHCWCILLAMVVILCRRCSVVLSPCYPCSCSCSWLLLVVGCWLLVVGWLVGWLAGWLAGWLVGWLLWWWLLLFLFLFLLLFVCLFSFNMSVLFCPSGEDDPDWRSFFWGGRDLGNQYPIESPDCLLALMLSLGIFIAQPGLLFWVFLKWGHVQIIHINRSFCKPSILW